MEVLFVDANWFTEGDRSVRASETLLKARISGSKNLLAGHHHFRVVEHSLLLLDLFKGRRDSMGGPVGPVAGHGFHHIRYA